MSADHFAPPPPPAPSPARVSRLWSAEPASAVSAGLLSAAVAVGVLGAATLRPHVMGSAYLVTGTAVLLVALAARGRRLTAVQTGALLVVVMLLAAALLRDTPWLVTLCLVGAYLVGTLALVVPRTWTGLAVGAVSTALAAHRAARWVQRRVAAVRLPALLSGRAWAVLAVSAALIVVFGGLFASADAAYGALLHGLVPDVGLPDLGHRSLVMGTVTSVAVLAAYVGHSPPSTDALAPGPGRPVRRGEWAVPLGLLDGLFLSFVLVQLTVLFGGREHVLATQGLTYAQYARHGFWQLLAVTVLTLAVIAVAVRTAPRSTAQDLVLVQLLLALLCVLALVVVASALHRMSLYEQQYGYTRLRVFVQAVELALGAAFLLLLAAGVRLDSTWLPRAGAGLGCLALLGLVVLNPDAYVAGRNVDRYEATGRIDVAYLSTLSADAVPALVRLPPELRACALARLAPSLRGTTDPWYDGNLARARARRLLKDQQAASCPTPG